VFNQATRYASQHMYLVPVPSPDKLGGLCQTGRASGIKMVGMVEVGAPISLDSSDG